MFCNKNVDMDRVLFNAYHTKAKICATANITVNIVLLTRD